MQRWNDEPLCFTYSDLRDYADRWRRQELTAEDRALLEEGVSDVAYKQTIDGIDYLIPLPKNIRILDVSKGLERRLTRPTR